MSKSQPKRDDIALYYFHAGTNNRAYAFLGAHREPDGDLVTFRVWAPHAQAVSVIGDFNDWDAGAAVMHRLPDSGVWECSIPDVVVFDNYKYHIVCANGTVKDKADPFAFHSETRPGTASKFYEMDGYRWKDDAWQTEKARRNPYESPMNIYEVHAGSWK